jgi:hypothetical protein
MIKLLRGIWHRKAIIIFLAFLVALLPSALTAKAQMMSKIILTEVTIDIDNGEYVLNGKAAKIEKETPETVQGRGIKLGDAVNNINEAQEKNVSFSHCEKIILGENFTKENTTELFNYFVKNKEINNNTKIQWAVGGEKTTLDELFKDYLRQK